MYILNIIICIFFRYCKSYYDPDDPTTQDVSCGILTSGWCRQELVIVYIYIRFIVLFPIRVFMKSMGTEFVFTIGCPFWRQPHVWDVLSNSPKSYLSVQKSMIYLYALLVFYLTLYIASYDIPRKGSDAILGPYHKTRLLVGGTKCQ